MLQEHMYTGMQAKGENRVFCSYSLLLFLSLISMRQNLLGNLELASKSQECSISATFPHSSGAIGTWPHQIMTLVLGIQTRDLTPVPRALLPTKPSISSVPMGDYFLTGQKYKASEEKS